MNHEQEANPTTYSLTERRWFVARPFNELIDEWRAKIGTLSVLANRSGNGIERLVELTDRAKVLGRAIDDEQVAFDAAVKRLPLGIATSPGSEIPDVT
jgi:hypothetical protein